MKDEELYHLIDMLEMRIASILMNSSDFRLLSDNQKTEAILFDKNLIKKMKSMTEGD